MKRFEICKNVFLNYIPSDKFKTNFLDLYAVTPLKKESASYASLLSAVLFRGCRKYPDMACLAKLLANLYATNVSQRVFKRGEMQVSLFSTDFLKNEYIPEDIDLQKEALDLLFDILLDPYTENGAFCADYVSGECQNIIDEIGAQINNKNAYAIKKCTELMCEGEDFAVCELGDEEILKSITPDSLYKFYKSYISSAKIEIFFTGNTDADTLCKYLQEKFSSVLRNSSFIPLKPEEKVPVKVREFCEKMPVKQGKLVLGYRMGYSLFDKDYIKFALFNELFGASPTSKLFENVREKMSLCYYCRSIPDALKSVMFITSGIENENLEKAKAAISQQLEDVKCGKVSDEELQDAKKSLENAYRELYDSPTSLSSFYLSRLLCGKSETLEDTIDAIAEVSVQDITDCAKSVTADTVYFLEGTASDAEE